MHKSSGMTLKDVTWFVWLLATIPLFWFMITEGRKRDEAKKVLLASWLLVIEEFGKDTPCATSLDQLDKLPRSGWVQRVGTPSFGTDRRGEKLAKIVVRDGDVSDEWAFETWLSLDQASYDFVVAHKNRRLVEILDLWRAEREKK